MSTLKDIARLVADNGKGIAMAAIATTLLKAIFSLPELFRSAKAGSLIEYTSVTRVEPVTIVDETILTRDYITDILYSANAIIAAYYLQAVAISVNVGKIDTVRLLDKLNPNRNPSDNAAMFIGDAVLSMEAYKHGLPTFNKPQGIGTLVENVTVEAFATDSATFGRDTLKNVTDISNLSVGTLLDVEINSDGQKATIPVSVRLIVSAAKPSVIRSIVGAANANTSIKERYHAWRAGQITFIRDMIFCQDLIDKQRAAMIQSDVYKEIVKRSNRNKTATIMSLGTRPSVATASNIMIITSETLTQLEMELGGKIANNKDIRVRLFSNTMLMLLIIVDTQLEYVTIWHRTLDLPTKMAVKDLKNSNRGKGPDVGEILRAYQLGSMPRF